MIVLAVAAIRFLLQAMSEDGSDYPNYDGDDDDYDGGGDDDEQEDKELLIECGQRQVRRRPQLHAVAGPLIPHERNNGSLG